MENELLNDLRAFVEKNSSSIIELNAIDSASASNNIAKNFIKNRNNIWWWEELNQKSITIEYGSSDGLLLIKKIINNDNLLINLFVTDDGEEPWPVFQGKLGIIIDMLYQQSFFEYFISADDFSWLIFDNHHNSLVISGELIDEACLEGIAVRLRQYLTDL